MKFSSKLFAIAAAITMMFSASAYAAIDLDADTGAFTYASEVTIAPTGTAVANAGNIMDTTVNAGFVISDGVTHYMRFDLPSGQLFIANPSLAVTDTGGAGGATETLTAGGIGADYAIFSVTPAAGQTVNTTHDAVLTITAAGLTINSQSAVTINYAMYETAGNAVNETAGTTLATEDGTIFTFTPGLAISGVALTTNQIDVTTGSLQFVTAGGVNTAVSPLGDIDITVVAGNQFEADGATDLTLADAVAAGTTLVVTGDFTMCQNDDGTYTGAALNRVFLDTDSVCDSIDTPASALTATTATFNIGDTATVAAEGLCISAEGTPTIPEGSYTSVYTVVAETGYTVSNTNMVSGTLAKNGASDTLNFALKPTTAFTNLVRITNSGTTTGDVFITLINDAGDSVLFNLADVAGFASSSLASGASTPYINITDLYAAAQVADPTFDNSSAQLRLNVSSTCTQIIVNGIVMSKDNNVFTVIDSAATATN